MTDPALQAAVERLEARYAAAIDADRLEEWPKFFADDCRYQIIAAENFEQQLPIAVFYATTRRMLEDRVRSLRRANIYEAQRYRHLLSPSLILSAEGSVVSAETNYQVIRITAEGAMTLFSCGRYLDRIALVPEPHFLEKLAIFDGRRIDTLLAIPI